MTKLLMILTLITGFSAIAQERVVLDRDQIYVRSNEAILVRTIDTPSKVKITMDIPMGDTYCERRDTRLVTITSSARCGVMVERIRRPVVTEVCVHRNPYNNVCLRTERRTTYTESVRNIPRTCQVTESYCAQYGVHRTVETDGVTLKFKKASQLIEGQEETFIIKGYQGRVDGSNVKYDVSASETLKPYNIKSVGVFGADIISIQGN